MAADGAELSLEINGGVYDDDTEEVTVAWSEEVIGDGTSVDASPLVLSALGASVECTYTRDNSTTTSWLARCHLHGAAAALICITATATNGARLTSSSTSCLTVDGTAPEWLSYPPLLTSNREELSVDFYVPSEPHTPPTAIEMAVCDSSQCSEFAHVYANGSAGSLTSVTVPLPANHSGPARVRLRAVNRAGLLSHTVTSNCVLAGIYPPETAHVELGPTALMNGLHEAFFNLTGFTRDPCSSGGVTLQLCVGTEVGQGDVMPCLNYSWSAASPSTVLLGSLVSLEPSGLTGNRIAASGFSAVATVTEYTQHSVRTVVSSRVNIDAIPPKMGSVSDGLVGGSSSEYDWQVSLCPAPTAKTPAKAKAKGKVKAQARVLALTHVQLPQPSFSLNTGFSESQLHHQLQHQPQPRQQPQPRHKAASHPDTKQLPSPTTTTHTHTRTHTLAVAGPTVDRL